MGRVADLLVRRWKDQKPLTLEGELIWQLQPCVLLKEEEFIIAVCFCHAKDDTIDYKYMMPMEKEINIRQNSTESLESEQHYKYWTDYIYWQTEFSICWCGRHIKYKIFLAAWFCCWKMKSWDLNEMKINIFVSNRILNGKFISCSTLC